jgi:hypothetical protein
MARLNALGCDGHMIGISDPVDMAARIQDLQRFEFRDDWSRRVSREILAAVLRKYSFDVERAADALESAIAPEDLGLSIPGQWQIYYALTRDDDGLCAARDPAEMKEFIAGLRELQTQLALGDYRGRPFCDEVIATAIRSRYWDPIEAGDRLIVMSDRIHRRDQSSNLEAKRAAYRKLTIRFPGIYVYSFDRLPKPWHAADPADPEDRTNLG